MSTTTSSAENQQNTSEAGAPGGGRNVSVDQRQIILNKTRELLSKNRYRSRKLPSSSSLERIYNTIIDEATNPKVTATPNLKNKRRQVFKSSDSRN